MATYQGPVGDAFSLSYDVPGRSVRLRWIGANGQEILDIFREGATNLTVSSGAGETQFIVTFQTGEFTGDLMIRIAPDFQIRDRLLFQ
ncbi:hypothetical protein ACFY2J_09030 [Streptomyces collinus]|uniref:hypothetical protein n=1 Tax=Streptomyces collinus TaxID=42684 RepID=UPI003690695E